MGISIALHVIPLIVRIKHNMQIHSKSLENVKRTFPLGYEIAQVFTFLLREKYIGDKKVSEDEIALIAAHFYGSLLELHQTKKSTRVLVLSSMKVSMTILLRSILMKWFRGEISVLDFLNSNKMNETVLDNYDIFLTTEKNKGMLEREKIGSTFFSRGIAIPHPLHSISSDTFVAAYISKNPVVWDEEGNTVQVVIMLHIGKNNPRFFQLWATKLFVEI